MKRLFLRILSLSLALVALLGLFIPSQTASAATFANINDSVFVFRNEKTNRCLNNYAGGTYNGNKTTLWDYSRSDTDLWVRCVARNGGYKIFDHELKIVVADVYRGSKTKAASGMKIDAWADQKSEDAYQIWIFERQSNGSYILRLKSQQNLALGITSNKNGAQLQLVKYNKNDASQRWFLCNTNGSKLTRDQIENASAGSANNLAGIPSANYTVDATYTIGTAKYQMCTVTRAWCNVSKGTVFFRNTSNNSIATGQTLQKLKTIQLVNSVRSTYIANLNSMGNTANSVYTVAARWTNNTKLTSVIGVSAGATLKAAASCALKQPVSVFDAAITVCSQSTSTENALATSMIIALKSCANDTVYWSNRAKTLLSNSITSYDKAVEAATAIANASGYYEATVYLGKPILNEAAAANPWTSTFQNMGRSILEGCGYSMPKAISMYEDAIFLKDLLSGINVTSRYSAARTRVLNKLILA